ncbi:hypothetical protein [Methylobacterium sp. 092160098-2]|jgi:hypothetical protein|uniref:hypothetical protein n=1 Tax=Methylobacterium sp. 092160098-2 TaxID=3025129 RepID=UPI002381C4C0|nr:hypothetical protein [Methylobacterium sp. 092160098-2]MDE4914915.1 hypothetical protein [Methylobacterium sp. 092160098-2]
MLTGKIATTPSADSGVVANALSSLGIETTAETLAHALRHSLHRISDGPFAALASSMQPEVLVAGLTAIGIEPIFIDVARKRMTAAGAFPDAMLDAVIERSVHAYIGEVVGTPM